MVPVAVCQSVACADNIQVIAASIGGRKLGFQSPSFNEEIPKIIAVTDWSFANEHAVAVNCLRPHFKGEIAGTEVAKGRILDFNLIVNAVKLQGIGLYNRCLVGFDVEISIGNIEKDIVRCFYFDSGFV